MSISLCSIVRHVRQQLVASSASRGFLAKKLFPHVVIDPDHRAAFGRETPDCFRTDQTSGARDENRARAFAISLGRLADHPGQLPIGRVHQAGGILVTAPAPARSDAGSSSADEKKHLARLIEERQCHR